MLTLVYDGACPFCTHYVLKQRIEAAYGPLILLDARSEDPRLLPYWAQGYPLDEGMLLDHDGTIRFGDAALAALARLSRSTGSLNNQRSANCSIRRSNYSGAPLYGRGVPAHCISRR